MISRASVRGALTTVLAQVMTMELKSIKRLLTGDPANRWGADILFVPLAIFAFAKVSHSRDSVLAGVAAALLIMGVRHLLFFGFVKRNRRRT